MIIYPVDQCRILPARFPASMHEVTALRCDSINLEELLFVKAADTSIP